MFPLLIPLITAAMGAANGAKKAEAERNDRSLQAATAAYSPWTHLQPQAVQPQGDATSGALQGLGSGLSINQSLDAAASDKKLKDALSGSLEAKKPFDTDQALANLPKLQAPESLGNAWAQSQPGRGFGFANSFQMPQSFGNAWAQSQPPRSWG